MVEAGTKRRRFAHFGKLDILINNAAIVGPERQPPWEISAGSCWATVINARADRHDSTLLPGAVVPALHDRSGTTGQHRQSEFGRWQQ